MLHLLDHLLAPLHLPLTDELLTLLLCRLSRSRLSSRLTRKGVAGQSLLLPRGGLVLCLALALELLTLLQKLREISKRQRIGTRRQLVPWSTAAA